MKKRLKIEFGNRPKPKIGRSIDKSSTVVVICSRLSTITSSLLQ